jgi:hypothetical protein
MRSRVLAQVERCIAEGVFPVTTHAEIALRLLWAPIFGIAALRLSQRFAPTVDADGLVRDAIDTTIAGIRAGAPRHSRVSMPNAQCSMPKEEDSRNAQHPMPDRPVVGAS